MALPSSAAAAASAASAARASQRPSSFDRLLADLLQVVSEILLIRQPRVQTASVLAVPEPPPDLLASLDLPACPFCPGGSLSRPERRLIH